MCFCFKQKTAYEMRISDWSSDVCSSDLLPETRCRAGGCLRHRARRRRHPLHYPAAAGRRRGAVVGGKITLAATQMACGWDLERNLAAAEDMVREAAGRGADLVLLQEFFETPYFCPDQKRSEEHTSELQSLMRN